MDRKAQGSNQRPTCQCQECQMGKPPIPEAMWSVDLQHRRNGGLSGPGLPRAARPKIPASEENTRRTDIQGGSETIHRRSMARWHNPRPAGLGWAARAPCSLSGPGFAWKLSTPLQLRAPGANRITGRLPTLEAYKYHSPPHL